MDRLDLEHPRTTKQANLFKNQFTLEKPKFFQHVRFLIFNKKKYRIKSNVSVYDMYMYGLLTWFVSILLKW